LLKCHFGLHDFPLPDRKRLLALLALRANLGFATFPRNNFLGERLLLIVQSLALVRHPLLFIQQAAALTLQLALFPL
jgi:hypothetical protein